MLDLRLFHRTGSDAFPVDKCALFVFALGFEDRAMAIPLECELAKRIVAIRYVDANGESPADDVPFRTHAAMDDRREVTWLDYQLSAPSQFASSLRNDPHLPNTLEAGEVWVDISGMTHFAAATILSWVRRSFSERVVQVLYTEAREYFPTFEEYTSLERRKSAVLPDSLSVDMDSLVLTDEFTGFSLRDQSSVLFLYPGYEPHRAFGLVGEYNPQKLALIFCKPDVPSLEWRLALSRKMHAPLKVGRPSAEEEFVSSDINGVLECLTTYYDHLYDDHNVVVAPACSKLHGVASFLFWERFRDVQLVFTKPVRYVPDRSCTGVGRSFIVTMPPPPRLLAIAHEYPLSS